MKTQNTLHLAGLLLLLSCAALLGPAASGDAQEVHALFIIAGNDQKIRDGVEADATRLMHLMSLVSVHLPVQLTVLKLEDELTGSVTRMSFDAGEARVTDKEDQELIQGKHVSAWLNGLHPAVEDTVLIYYTGHSELRSSDNAHILLFTEPETVPRDLLRAELEKIPGRLKMLITDTDGGSPSVRALEIAEPEQESRTFRVSPREGRKESLQHLFSQHEGMLDINAASPGEYAWLHRETGSFFTQALIESVHPATDVNEDGFISWTEVFAVMRELPQTQIQQIQAFVAPKPSQTPVAYSLPEPVLEP